MSGLPWIYLEYSRYRCGEKMTLAGKWRWHAAGSRSRSSKTAHARGQKPVMDVVKV